MQVITNLRCTFQWVSQMICSHSAESDMGLARSIVKVVNLAIGSRFSVFSFHSSSRIMCSNFAKYEIQWFSSGLSLDFKMCLGGKHTSRLQNCDLEISLGRFLHS